MARNEKRFIEQYMALTPQLRPAYRRAAGVRLRELNRMLEQVRLPLPVVGATSAAPVCPGTGSSRMHRTCRGRRPLRRVVPRCTVTTTTTVTRTATTVTTVVTTTFDKK
ncbi:hypothetical protein ACGF1Z_11050 [Streptomyces sp. NPDC048018]|uniref:hypothetical protein n=1 Tax=Streptomyces sp. NPDC048018 TaxID=3365499 RepID=UPI0037247521